jgi:hypothetical protein
MRTVARGWARFTSDVGDGRDLFYKTNREAIKEAASHLKMGNSGAAVQHVLKEQWAAAEQGVWNQKAREEIDISA